MPGTALKMTADTKCVLCWKGLKKSEPGVIAAFKQKLSFTKKQAIDLLEEVLNTKVRRSVFGV